MMMVACSLLLGVWTVYVQPFRNQQQVREQLADAGVPFEIEQAMGSAFQRWLVTTVLGESAFVDVTSVDLRESKADEATLVALRYLPRLKQLLADGVPITEEAILGLQACGELRELSLRHTPVDDELAATLGRLPQLELLFLTGTSVSDDGLQELARSPKLKELFVRWTPVTKTGAAKFERAVPGCKVHVQTISLEE